MKRLLVSSIFILVALLVGCSTPTPEVIEKEVTRVVEGATQVVEKVVKETVVVEGTPQVIEKVVTEEERWVGPGFGGILHVVMGGAPPTLDSPTTTELSTQMVTLQINETLVAMSEKYKVVPMLAHSWDVSDDGLTYTFYLRKGIKFHNGEEMTAKDVIASYDRFLQVSARADSFSMVESREVVDDYTVKFTLSEPNRQFLTALAYVTADMCIQPKSVIEGKGAGELVIPDDIIGTGPYRLAQYDPDNLIVLERFEDYQPLPGGLDGMAGGKIPYYDAVYIHIVPDPPAQMLGLESGEYYLGAEISDVEAVMDNPDINVKIFYPGYSAMLLINHNEKFTNDVKFRQAVNAVLDMEEIGMFTTHGMKDYFRLNPTLWPPEGAMYLPNDEFADSQYNQNDVEKAKQLLAETGYNGEEIIFTTTRDWGEFYDTSVAIVDQLQNKLGLNIKIDVYDPATLDAISEEASGWHLTLGQFGSYNFFPMVLYNFWNCNSTSSLHMGYCNSAFDGAYGDAIRATNDEEEEAAYREIQHIFWEDLPAIKLFEAPNIDVYRKEVKNFSPWYRYRFFGSWLEEYE